MTLTVPEKVKRTWHNTYYRWTMLYLCAINTVILIEITLERH